MSEFDEVYTEYQKVLLQLNQAEDIGTKNALFKQLTELLSQMEHLIIAQTPGQILRGRKGLRR